MTLLSVAFSRGVYQLHGEELLAHVLSVSAKHFNSVSLLPKLHNLPEPRERHFGSHHWKIHQEFPNSMFVHVQ